MFKNLRWAIWTVMIVGALAAGGLFQLALAVSPVRFTGVNLAGADFGDNNLPGTYNADYTYPTHTEVDYFVGKGMNTVRLPFRWERVQRTLFGSFDPTEQTRLDDVVNYATGKGAFVLLDPHNYARYRDQVIGQGVSVDAFTDFWSKLATRYKGNSKVIFGLMNEPHDMPTELWRDDANAAIRAIRTTGATNLILVPGNGYSGAHSWYQSWYGTSNAQVMLGITDPGNNYAFEVHQYLDGDASGQSDQCMSTTIGSERLREFTGWLKQNGKRGFLGEFAGGRNATCYAALDNMLTYIDSNADVWLGWTYWAAGPWWGDYMFTLEPVNGTDRPQMVPLSKHVAAPSATPTPPASSPPTPTPTPSAATTRRIEAGATANYTDSTGNVWVADTGFVGGSTADRGNIAIANTNNPRIYQTERYGMSGYQLGVANGTYTIKLHFAETYTGITGPGQRVFGVNVEGVQLNNIDVFAETGGLNRALVKTLQITVADGQLDLKFAAVTNYPEINGIEVLP